MKKNFSGLAVKLAILCAAGLFAGCVSTGGPFVTNISSAGRGKVSVEKCKIEFNPWSSNISTGQCSSATIYLDSKDHNK